MTVPNLDFICADYGRRIGDDESVEESLLNKTIGVLQENGLYALMLYLSSRGSTEVDGGKHITKNQIDLLYDTRLGICTDRRQDQFATAQQLAQNLDRLLFAKSLCEQTLIYGRYHAKARE